MPEIEFAVEYDGPILADGTMPVSELAPALLALGDLFVEASRVAHPDREPVALNFRATDKGSFLVDLTLLPPDTWERIVHLLSSPTADALTNLRDLVIGSGAGLFLLLKWVRKRRIERREPVAAGRVRVTLEDGSSLEVPAEVLALYDNPRVREKAQQVVKPVDRPGVERVRFRAEQTITVEIEKADLPAYDVPEPEETPIGEYVHETVVAVETVSFAEGYKWRFSEGDSVITASIEDPAFRARIDHREAFQKGDALRVRMRVVQTQRGDRLQVERTVEQVLEHIPRGLQLRLTAADKDDQ